MLNVDCYFILEFVEREMALVSSGPVKNMDGMVMVILKDYFANFLADLIDADVVELFYLM